MFLETVRRNQLIRKSKKSLCFQQISENRVGYTEKKTWYCGQASCSLFTNFFGKKVTTNFSLSKLQTKFIDNRLNR